MRFAKWVFGLAGISGLLMVVPPFFLEERFNEDHPPAITHPELYYGFFGLCVAWQVMFLIIASDPVRFRPAMLAALVEKASYAIAVPILYATGRVPLVWVGFAAHDTVWFVLFAIAFLRTGSVPYTKPSMGGTP
jgi:hypothetical protein